MTTAAAQNPLPWESFDGKVPANHGVLLFALLLSLLLHGILASQVRAPDTTPVAVTDASVLRMRLRQPHVAAPLEAQTPHPALQPISSTAQRRERIRQVEARPDESTLPDNWRELVIESEAPESVETENRATVINSALLRRLNDAERRTGYLPGSSTTPEALDYDAGSYTYLVKDGDYCFRVRAANPLEPFSADMWYRVACR